VLQGRDVVGLAQTGTGKTAAFLLPILTRMLEGKPGTLRALVVVPTRELAEQVLESARALAEGTGIRATSVYGGVKIEHHKERLRKPLDLIVGCPGRLLDLLSQRALSLKTIEHLVLDEADQMFDMGFIEPIRKLIKATPSERQSLLFSATMPPEIEQLTGEVLTKPVKIQVAAISSPDTVTHVAYKVPSHLKQKLLTHLLGNMSTESVLVFTRTKHRARKVAQALSATGVNATSLQGNLSQSQRMAAMKGFRSGKFAVMVATDIASRGIDISTVSHVVNFDFPDTHEAYLHRTGRTGRAARTGDAFTFIAPEDEGDFRRLERSLKIPFAKGSAEGFDFTEKPSATKDTDFGSERRFERPARGGGFGGRDRGSRRPADGPRRFGTNRGSNRSRFDGERKERFARPERSERWGGGDRFKPETEGAEGRTESFGNNEASNRSRFDYESNRRQYGAKRRFDNRSDGGKRRFEQGGASGEPNAQRAEGGAERPWRKPRPAGERSRFGERAGFGGRERTSEQGEAGARRFGTRTDGRKRRFEKDGSGGDSYPRRSHGSSERPWRKTRRPEDRTSGSTGGEFARRERPAQQGEGSPERRGGQYRGSSNGRTEGRDQRGGGRPSRPGGRFRGGSSRGGTGGGNGRGGKPFRPRTPRSE
jgi:ATP-dependent RNA helicase RhlE